MTGAPFRRTRALVLAGSRRGFNMLAQPASGLDACGHTVISPQHKSVITSSMQIEGKSAS
jgi:hypothetical protein